MSCFHSVKPWPEEAMERRLKNQIFDCSQSDKIENGKNDGGWITLEMFGWMDWLDRFDG